MSIPLGFFSKTLFGISHDSSSFLLVIFQHLFCIGVDPTGIFEGFFTISKTLMGNSLDSSGSLGIRPDFQYFNGGSPTLKQTELGSGSTPMEDAIPPLLKDSSNDYQWLTAAQRRQMAFPFWLSFISPHIRWGFLFVTGRAYCGDMAQPCTKTSINLFNSHFNNQQHPHPIKIESAAAAAAAT